ncbi:short-chain dehydrogenase [Burkholderia lata]|uniref:Short-chain dehydrogenase n=2 Tax=Burkholderia lata (strain ATCC 17760 / DSM 23089 / LMG 22485 / NCIMB 9086 / R18194 / 383) TaxID=482957 RepID=A0A6P2ZNF3_BURL3|nr:short-chain dehydrogenase [Burkholderia lata]
MGWTRSVVTSAMIFVRPEIKFELFSQLIGARFLPSRIPPITSRRSIFRLKGEWSGGRNGHENQRDWGNTVLKLHEKVTLVTGGSSGIGRATALLFAGEGARVAIASRRVDEGLAVVEEIRRAGGEALFVKTDVSMAEDCARMVAETVRVFGRLDVAFNNAGVEAFGKAVADTDEASWDYVMDINLKGMFLSMKYEIPEMLKAGGGAIVNMSSTYGVVASAFGGCAYHASKAGILGLTKAAALEYAKQNIRVNAICPAFVATAMVEKFLDETRMTDQIKAFHPVGRLGTEKEIAEAVTFLACDASSFMTGTALSVDGGMAAA